MNTYICSQFSCLAHTPTASNIWTFNQIIINLPNLRESLCPKLREHPEELLEVVGDVRLDVLLQRLPVLVLEQVRDRRTGRKGARLLRIAIRCK